jgi:hypothetical protein
MPLVQGQTFLQSFQHFLSAVYPGQLLSQPRVAAELTPDLDSIALPCREKGLFRTAPDTYAAGQAAAGINPGNA